MSLLFRGLLCLVACLALPACGRAPAVAPTPSSTTQASAKATKPLALMASTPLIRDALVNLTAGVDGVTVTSLIPSGADPHEFEPTPNDVRAVAEASAIFVNGAGLEDEWLDKLLKNAGGQKPVIVAGDGVQLVRSDPHIWQDPSRWQQAVLNLAKGLIALDPGIASTVNANAAGYNAKLVALDGDIKNEVALLPPEKRVLVTTHDALGYFAERYGFRIVGAVIPSVSSAAAPSAKNVKDLVDAVKANRVKAIFTEAGVNPKLTEAVASETGVKLVGGLYLDTLTDAAGPAPTYLDMMRHNAKLIVNALK